jgi:hypothetical protein
MTWNSYGLDRIAQRLVLDARQRGQGDSLNQSYKMRMAVAYGLERFWGENLRLSSNTKKQAELEKAQFWKDTWDALVKVMADAGVTIPNDAVSINDPRQIDAMSERLWTEVKPEQQRVALAVLTQLCDCIVWWTQRYKVGRLADDSDS